jgi:hypothetical protein
MNRRFALAILALLALATPLHAAEEAVALAAPAADNTARIDAARSAIAEWLKLSDSGDYAAMWNTASMAFKSAVTEAGWSQAATSVRTPLGALQTRTEASAQYSTSLPGAPAGEYVVLMFTTSYANMKATETLVATLEADGGWRGAGYLIRPAQ